MGELNEIFKNIKQGSNLLLKNNEFLCLKAKEWNTWVSVVGQTLRNF